MPDNLLPEKLTAGQIRSFINFDGGEHIDITGTQQSRAQSEGVAALWHLLRNKGFAYLADEVGMGKTRQAMAVIALQLLEDPKAQIVIVCPGQTLQRQWLGEWDAFLRSCYKLLDNRLRSALTGLTVSHVAMHERVSDFAHALQLNEHRIHLLRYSSFSRPLFFGAVAPNEQIDLNADFVTYASALIPLGASPSTKDSQALRDALSQDSVSSTTREELIHMLSERYATQVGHLLCARGISLAVFDEAQYLRHVDNLQNRHIRQMFRPHARRWLFLSATPLHSGPGDLRSLDAYLGDSPSAKDQPPHCASCVPQGRSPQIAARMKPGAAAYQDVVDIMREFMVRRVRTYQDGDGNTYLKSQYRSYQRARISGTKDPFTALTMALVQKRLVQALDGHNNRFSQGECSSFESLATSVRSHSQRAATTKAKANTKAGARAGEHVLAEFEPATDHLRRDSQTSIDRATIDALAASFNEAASQLDRRANPNQVQRYSLPHAKLIDVAHRVFENSLHNASCHKSLVFVRRLDTVEELLAHLRTGFQKEVDRRLSIWHDWLAASGPALVLRQPHWVSGQFWNSAADSSEDAEDDPQPDEPSENEPGDMSGKANDLEYFRAIRYLKGEAPGKLHSFQARLRNTRVARNPLGAFLQAREVQLNAADAEAWKVADEVWIELVKVCLGEADPSLTDPGQPLHWLVHRPEPGSPTFWKLATLQRCLLQSMRQTDLLVDLYVLNRYVASLGAEGVNWTLPRKLLWLLGAGGGPGHCAFPEQLTNYASNWRTKLRDWMLHFDTIIDKCMRGGTSVGWEQIHERANGAFDRMQPVFGRSGRLEDQNAVPQFKFPVHPNVLVCTDVLKEGVDLHLFCDDVIHYGVAWTSGDLEQRIGRVDRFGSLISRRLAVSRQEHWKTQGRPRLKVEFPFLDGTLDAPQVNRVIVAKVRSDMRMDLGRRSDEIDKLGELNLDDLDDSDGTVATAAAPVVYFYPEGVPKDDALQLPAPPDLIIDMLACDAATLSHGRDELHMPRLGVVRIRGNVVVALSGNPLLRRVKVTGRRSVFDRQEEWLSCEAHEGASLSLGRALREADPVSTTALEGSRLFRFDTDWNTLVHCVDVDRPLAPASAIVQPVLLEALGDFLLLRAPLFPASAVHDDAWLGSNDQRCEWAYLTSDAGTVWLVSFVARSNEPAVIADVVDHLASRLGRLAGSITPKLSCSLNATPCTYRSRTALPPCTEIAAFWRNERGILMIDARWQGAGDFLSGMEAWFRAAFSDVLLTLKDGTCSHQGPMSMAMGGVLHLSTQGPERFSLQAFVQPGNVVSDAGGVIEGPWIVWELVASTSTLGAKPTLPHTPWHYMPHFPSSEGWHGEEKENFRVYVSQDERYRYLAVYHRPKTWDARRSALLTAWADALPRMQGTNFQRQALRQSFLNDD